MVIFQLDLG